MKHFQIAQRRINMIRKWVLANLISLTLIIIRLVVEVEVQGGQGHIAMTNTRI